MSGTDVIGELLFAHAPLLSAVPKGQIKVEELPESTEPPYIVLETITGRDRETLAPTPLKRTRWMVRATVCAGNISEREAILRLVRAACSFKLGDFAGLTAVDVRTSEEGPPIKVSPGNIYTRAQDFSVSANQLA